MRNRKSITNIWWKGQSL